VARNRRLRLGLLPEIIRQRHCLLRLKTGHTGRVRELCGVSGEDFVAVRGGGDRGGVRNLSPDFSFRRVPWEAWVTSSNLGE
jgi:hypothetical protein